MNSPRINRLKQIEKKISKNINDTERRTIAVTKSLLNYKKYNRFLRILGPGLVTGAADDDPSGIATYSQAGARFGLNLLWTFPLMYPLLLTVQESCARIGAITGKGLAAIIKDHYSKTLLYLSVMLVVIANIINIGANLGAMASTTQLFVEINFNILTIIYALIILMLVVFVRYRNYARILKWLALALLSYPITVFIINQDWSAIFKNTFNLTPELSFESIYILVGMLGTTISPYLFFWDTSEQVEEEILAKNLNKIGTKPLVTKHYLHKIRIDNFIGMSLASITAWFIVIACASTLNQNGIINIETASDAARALEPLVNNFPNAGLIARLIFSFGIIGLGLLAIPVLAGSASYAISETFGWHEGLYNKFKQAIGFYGVIILATLAGLIINFIGINPIRALIFTAVFNGIAAVPLLAMLLKIGNNKEIMGDYRNGKLSNSIILLTFLIMTMAIIFLFISFVLDRT